MNLNSGNVYWVNPDPTKGSEIRKMRPWALVGATPINKARRTVVVAPLSTTGKPIPPLTFRINCMEKQAVAVCDQIRAVDKARLLKQTDTLSKENMNALDAALRQVLTLG